MKRYPCATLRDVLSEVVQQPSGFGAGPHLCS